MQKQLWILLNFLMLTFLQAQSQTFTSGDGSMSITVDKLNLSNGKDNYSQGASSGTTREYHYTSPSSSDIITEMYKKKETKEYEEAVKAWKQRDWDKAITHFKRAEAYHTNNQIYEAAISQARGYKEWDKGVEEAKNENWDKAIERYKEALQYFPNDNTLMKNIIECSYSKILELAAKEYNNQKDCVNIAVYYYILWKNFGDSSELVQQRYSHCSSIIENMKQSEKGHLKFESRLSEVRKELPFINSNWNP